MIRYAALVDCVDALLREFSPDDVGLYQIAERARVPPASVYHFFPTKEAAFLALAQRYLQGFRELWRLPVEPWGLAGWQSLMAWDQKLAMDYYNSHPPALKLFLGGFGGIETRQVDIAFNAQVGNDTYLRFDRAFHMPYVREPEKKFHIVMEILDAVWAISYMKYDRITEEYRQEALDATTAYCRMFLPERVELREEHKLALERGEPVILVRSGDRGDESNTAGSGAEA